jgi:hypothetical protein
MITFSPREAFRKSDAAKAWNDASASEVFMKASAAALLQMVMELQSADGNQAASNQYRIEGAKMMLRNLMNLTSSDPTKRDLPANQNLDHKV